MGNSLENLFHACKPFLRVYTSEKGNSVLSLFLSKLHSHLFRIERNIIIVFIFLLPWATYCQSRQEDSLVRIVNKVREDTASINLLLSICNKISNENPDRALKIGQEALVISRKVQWKKGIARSKECIGRIYLYKADYNNALQNLDEALTIYKDLEDNISIASALGWKGTIYYYKANYPKALDYYNEELSLGNHLNNKNIISQALFYKGNIFSLLTDYPQALDYYQQSLLYAEQSGNQDISEESLNNMGDVYCSIGNYTKSKECYEQSYEINSKLDDKPDIMFNLQGLGEVYFALCEYRKSIGYYLQSEHISQEIDDKVTQAECIREIASCYNSLKLYDSAFVSGKQALELENKVTYKLGVAKSFLLLGEISDNTGSYLLSDSCYLQSVSMANEIGAKDVERDAWKGLSDVYEKNHEPAKSLKAYKNYVALKDTISNSEKTKLIVQEEIKFDEIKKKMADEAIAKKNEWKRNLQMIAIAIFIFSFIIAVLMLSRIKAKPNVIKVLGMVGLLLVFEFISLLMEPVIAKWTNDTPLYSLLLLVIIAAVLIPTHHRLEHWVKEKLAHKHHPKTQ